ncbi:MAG: hypothetical protein ABIS29_08210, partial [Vicinamibacterales bacterium]
MEAVAIKIIATKNDKRIPDTLRITFALQVRLKPDITSTGRCKLPQPGKNVNYRLPASIGGVRFASPSDVKRTFFSVALLGLGVAALGGFENGDGVPQPPAKEWARRNAALAGAKVFRDGPFAVATADFAADPNRGVVDFTLTSCKYKPDRSSGT